LIENNLKIALNRKNLIFVCETFEKPFVEYFFEERCKRKEAKKSGGN
jgi:hypothetical protein